MIVVGGVGILLIDGRGEQYRLPRCAVPETRSLMEHGTRTAGAVFHKAPRPRAPRTAEGGIAHRRGGR